MENNKKPKPKTRKTGLWSAQLPFSFLRCSAGISGSRSPRSVRPGRRCGTMDSTGILKSDLPALLLLVSPFSGTGLPAVPGTLVYPELRRVYPEERRACAPPCCLLRRNPSNLGFTTASHSMNARGQAEARPTKNKFLIANPELEFSLSSIKTAPYKFLIAKK